MATVIAPTVATAATAHARRGSTPSPLPLPPSPNLSTNSLSSSSGSSGSSVHLSPAQQIRKVQTLPASFALHSAASTAENTPNHSPSSHPSSRNSSTHSNPISRTPSPQPEHRSIKLKTEIPDVNVNAQKPHLLKQPTAVYPNVVRVEEDDKKENKEDEKNAVQPTQIVRRAPRSPEMVILQIRCKNMPVSTTVVGVFEMMTHAFRYLDHTDVQRDTTNPTFTRNLSVHHVPTRLQKLKFNVYHISDNTVRQPLDNSEKTQEMKDREAEEKKKQDEKQMKLQIREGDRVGSAYVSLSDLLANRDSDIEIDLVHGHNADKDKQLVELQSSIVIRINTIKPVQQTTPTAKLSAQESIMLMIRGHHFIKYPYDSKKPPVKRAVFYRIDASQGSMGTLFWGPVGKRVLDHEHSIRFSTIDGIYCNDQTEAFRNVFRRPAARDRCFSIIAKNRTLDLEAESRHIRDAFILAIHTILVGGQGVLERLRLHEHMNGFMGIQPETKFLTGCEFLKYNYSSTGATRKIVLVDLEMNILYWCKPQRGKKPLIKSSEHCISMADIVKVEAGKTTPTFLKRSAHKAVEERCFSIISSTRTLDLEATSPQLRDDWVKFLNHYITHHQLLRQQQLALTAEEETAAGKGFPTDGGAGDGYGSGPGQGGGDVPASAAADLDHRRRSSLIRQHSFGLGSGKIFDGQGVGILSPQQLLKPSSRTSADDIDQLFSEFDKTFTAEAGLGPGLGAGDGSGRGDHLGGGAGPGAGGGLPGSHHHHGTGVCVGDCDHEDEDYCNDPECKRRLDPRGLIKGNFHHHHDSSSSSDDDDSSDDSSDDSDWSSDDEDGPLRRGKGPGLGAGLGAGLAAAGFGPGNGNGAGLGPGRGGGGRGGGRGNGFGNGDGDGDGNGKGGKEEKKEEEKKEELEIDTELKDIEPLEAPKPKTPTQDVDKKDSTEQKGMQFDENGVPIPPDMSDVVVGGEDVPCAPPMMLDAPRRTIKLRQLHWEPLPMCDTEGTMWITLNAGEFGDTSELDEIFAAPSAADLVKQESDNKSKVISLGIDKKRAYNIEIGLRRMKMTPIEMRDAILQMDPAVMNEERTSIMLATCPTAEEMVMVSSYKGDISLLGNVEQFFIAVSPIPNLRARLECQQFRMKFVHTIQDLSHKLKQLWAAGSILKTSHRLKHVLAVVLSIGNYLNEGSIRGQAAGFRLNSLTQLTNTKSKDNKMSLLDFIVRYIDRSRHPLDENGQPQPTAETEEPYLQELSCVQLASAVEWQQTVDDMEHTRASLQQIKDLLAKNEPLPESIATCTDGFQTRFTTFYETASKSMDTLQQQMNQIMELEQELLTYFGERDQRSKMTLHVMFGIFATFISNYNTSEKKLVEIRQQALKRAMAALNPQSASSSQPGSRRSSLESGEQQGDMSLASILMLKRASIDAAAHTSYAYSQPSSSVSSERRSSTVDGVAVKQPKTAHMTKEERRAYKEAKKEKKKAKKAKKEEKRARRRAHGVPSDAESSSDELHRSDSNASISSLKPSSSNDSISSHHSDGRPRRKSSDKHRHHHKKRSSLLSPVAEKPQGAFGFEQESQEPGQVAPDASAN